jgi:DNA-directed RNA polymerase specialized sigma24 family protein
VFIIAGIGVHDGRNRCSRSVGNSVHDRPESAFMMGRNAQIALAIFQNLRYLRHPGAFRSWAFRIASRRAFRHLKRETRWKLLEHDPDAISSIEETAIVLDIPVGTAKSRLAYGVSVLRKRINQKGTR